MSDESSNGRTDRLHAGGNIRPAELERLARRTAVFQAYTSGKGRRLTYGTGTPPEPPKQGKRRK